MHFEKWYNHFVENEIRFTNELFRIIRGALDLDVDKVRNYTAFLADKLESAGERNSALRLRRLLEESDRQLHPTNTKFAATVPVDEESRFPLLERVDLRRMNEPEIVLSEDQQAEVTEFLSVAKSYAQLEAESTIPSVSILLYGPPGCGKSRLARHIATSLGLDLYLARLDGLVSSFLGSTSKNIRVLFEFASRTPCTLFLDEFDAIAKLRSDPHELGELKRVVNSFIQSLDTLGTQSVVVAATNHESLLDAAVWRRFSYRLEMGYPQPQLRAQMWRIFLQPWAFSVKQIAILTDLSDGFSGSDLRSVALRLHHRQVIRGSDPRLKDALDGLRAIAIGEGEDRKFLAGLKGRDSREIAAILRHRNPKLYSHAALAQLLGSSTATTYRWSKEHVDG